MQKIIGKKKPYIYDGIEHDSKEEIYFSWYLNELQECGIVERYDYQEYDYLLSYRVKVTQEVQLKTKKKYIHRALLREQTYSPDFVIRFKEGPCLNRFVENYDYQNITRLPKSIPFLCFSKSYTSIVDIKPIFERQSSRKRAFSLIQSWLYQKDHVYVQPIIYQNLFAMTFTPERFLWTDGGGMRRKIGFNVRSLTEYLAE